MSWYKLVPTHLLFLNLFKSEGPQNYIFNGDHKMSLDAHARNLSGLNTYCVAVSLWASRLPFRDFSFLPEFHVFNHS